MIWEHAEHIRQRLQPLGGGVNQCGRGVPVEAKNDPWYFSVTGVEQHEVVVTQLALSELLKERGAS